MDTRKKNSASFLEALAGVSVEALRSAPGELHGGLARYGRWLTTPLLIAATALVTMFLAGNIASDAARNLVIVVAAIVTFLFLIRSLIRGAFLIIPGHYFYNTYDSVKFFIELPVRVLGGILILIVVMLKWPGEHSLHAWVFMVGLLSMCLALIDSASLRAVRSMTNFAIFVTVGFLVYQSSALPNSVRNAINNTVTNWSEELPNQLPTVSIADIAAGTVPRVDYESGKVIVFYAKHENSPCGFDFYREELYHPITAELTKPATKAIYESVTKCYKERSLRQTSAPKPRKPARISHSDTGPVHHFTQNKVVPRKSDSALREIAESLTFDNGQLSSDQPYRGLYVIIRGVDLGRTGIERSVSRYYNADRAEGSLPIIPVFSKTLSGGAADLLRRDKGQALQRSGVFGGPAELLVLKIDMNCTPDEIYNRFQLCRIDGDAVLHTKNRDKRESEIVLAVLGVTPEEAVQDALKDLAKNIDI